jgi:hypothetical protein
VQSYIVDKRTTPDVNVLPIKRILQQSHDIVPNSILRRETFCPGEKLAGINGGLFHRETDYQ